MPSTPTMRQIRDFVTTRVPITLYCLVGLGLVFQGVRYIGATEIMPYHLAVIESPWEDLGSSYQTLLLGLLRGLVQDRWAWASQS